MEEFKATQTTIELSSKTLNSEFLQSIKAADTNKIFSDQRRNPELWASLVTTVRVFGAAKAEESEDYLSKAYSFLAHLSTIKEEDVITQDGEATEGSPIPGAPGNQSGVPGVAGID